MLSRQAVKLWRPAFQTSNVSTIAGPPQVKVSFAEKLATGIFMTCGMLAIPAWVMGHIKEYKGQA